MMVAEYTATTPPSDRDHPGTALIAAPISPRMCSTPRSPSIDALPPSAS